jgi:hypothetical protein
VVLGDPGAGTDSGIIPDLAAGINLPVPHDSFVVTNLYVVTAVVGVRADDRGLRFALWLAH